MTRAAEQYRRRADAAWAEHAATPRWRWLKRRRLEKKAKDLSTMFFLSIDDEASARIMAGVEPIAKGTHVTVIMNAYAKDGTIGLAPSKVHVADRE